MHIDKNTAGIRDMAMPLECMLNAYRVDYPPARGTIIEVSQTALIQAECFMDELYPRLSTSA
jgi:hypothetical protein